MINLKKFGVILLAMAMVIALGACNGDDPQDTTASTPSETPSESTTEPEIFDMDGATIRVAAWWEWMPQEDAADEAGRRRYARMRDLEETYNFTFEEVVVPANDIYTLFDAATLSGEPYAEIIYMRSEMSMPYAMGGQLFPVNTIFDLSLEQFNPSITSEFTFNGDTYAFSTAPNSIECTMYFNKDIFERAGLEMPYDLVENREWTWEVFEDYVERSTVIDPATNEPEVYGFYGITSDAALSYLMGTFGAEFVRQDDRGYYTSGLDEPVLMEALNYIHDLNTTMPGVFLPEVDAAWDLPINMFVEGEVAMIQMGVWAGNRIRTNMTDRFGLVPLPLKNAGDEYTNLSQSHNLQVMPVHLDEEFAQQIAKVYTLFHAPIYDDPEEAREQEIATYEAIFWDRESIDTILMLGEEESRIFNHYSATGTVFWNALNTPLRTALRGETSVATVIAAGQEAFEEAIRRTNEENFGEE